MKIEIPDQLFPSTLPHEVGPFLARWSLVPDGSLITTRSSWVVPVRFQSQSAMLKVARIPDEHAGYRLMSWWRGDGAARVLAATNGALLMERAAGKQSLADMARSGQDDEACRILCRAAAKLHAPRAEPISELHHLDRWFQPLFDLSNANPVLLPAANAARSLLANQQGIRPLHGDLHHDNVLDFGERGWLAIDPHGLLGDRGFDFANIFTNPDLADRAIPVSTLPGRFEARLQIVSQEAGIEPARVLDWVTAWTGLSAAWFIGDGDDVGAQFDLAVNAIAQRLRSA